MIVDMFVFVVALLITFTIVGFLYRYYTVRNLKKNKNNLPSEVIYILNIHKIKRDDVDIDKLIRLVILVTTIIFSVVITISLYGGDYFNKLIIGIILMFPLLFISYYYIGVYAKKNFMLNKNKESKKKVEDKKNGYKKNRK